MVKLSSAHDSDIITLNRQMYKNRHKGTNANHSSPISSNE